MFYNKNIPNNNFWSSDFFHFFLKLSSGNWLRRNRPGVATEVAGGSLRGELRGTSSQSATGGHRGHRCQHQGLGRGRGRHGQELFPSPGERWGDFRNTGEFLEEGSRPALESCIRLDTLYIYTHNDIEYINNYCMISWGIIKKYHQFYGNPVDFANHSNWTSLRSRW